MEDSRSALAEIARCPTPGGTTLVQLAQTFGLLALFRQARRGCRKPTGFEVRHWSAPAMRRILRELVGPCLRAGAFLNLNPQVPDMRLLSRRLRASVRLSEGLRALSERLPPLIHAADSVYLEAREPGGQTTGRSPVGAGPEGSCAASATTPRRTDLAR